MSVPKRFSVLSLIGTLFKVAAWFVLILSLLSALLIGFIEPILRQSLFDLAVQDVLLSLTSVGGIVVGLMVMASGVVGFLALFATGESIHLQIAIEENTRLTAALLRKLDQDNSPLQTGKPYNTYYGDVIEG